LLGRVIIGVGDDPAGTGLGGQDVLPGGQGAQVGHDGLDDEAAARGEMPGDVAEAGDLRFLCGEVVDGVEHQVGHRESAVYPGRGHVADGYGDSVAAWLATQLGGHRPGQFDAVHRYAAL